jgi:hypothetical protein
MLYKSCIHSLSVLNSIYLTIITIHLLSIFFLYLEQINRMHELRIQNISVMIQ